MRHEGKVVLHFFAEAYAGVEENVFFGKTGVHEDIHLLFEECCDLAHHVIIVGVLLHGARNALTVHEHVARAVLHEDVEESRIKSEGRDVIDDIHAAFEHGNRGLGMVCVHGDERRDAHGLESVNDGHEPAGFRGRIDRGRSGTGGFPPQINDIGPVEKKLSCVGQAIFRAVVTSAIVE